MYCHLYQYICFFILASAGLAYALPVGGNITSGTGDITTEGDTTTINQGSARLDINWDDFSSPAHETITFNQPGSTSIAINRVIGGVPSQLNGALNANGRVFVINNAGITFGAGAQVNVGALVATTHNVTEMPDGSFQTQADAYGKIVNHGNITVSPGGFAILSAPHIENNGVIQADLGEVHLASGTKSTLDFRGDGKILFTVQDGGHIDVPENAPVGVDHNGVVQARSGMVQITAKKASDVVASVINLDGVVDATSLTSTGDGGSILVASADHIDLMDNAVLDASAQDHGNGGDVIVIAEKIAVAREHGTMRSRGGDLSGDGGFMKFSGLEKLFVFGSNFDAQAPNGEQGTILFDPTDVTIGALGGGFINLLGIDAFADPDVGNGIILNTLLNAALADVVIQATNNVVFDAAVNFLNIGALLFDRLTVQAGNSILVNADITAVGDFDLIMVADDATSPANGNDGIGAITIADGVTIDVNGGTIDLTAAQDITLGSLVSTNAGASAITLTSTLGGIIDGGDTDVDVVSAGRLNVNAATVYNRLSNSSQDSNLYGAGIGLDVVIDSGIAPLGKTYISVDAATSVGSYSASTQQGSYAYLQIRQGF